MSITKSTSTSLPRQDLAASLMSTAMLWTPIADVLFPEFPTPKKSGGFGVVPAKALLQRADVARAKDGGYNRTTWVFQDDSYSCKEYGHEERADDSERENYSDVLDYEMVLAHRGRMILAREREARVTSIVLNTTNFPLSGNTGKTVSTAWTNTSTATPIADCASARDGIRNRYGITGDCIVIPISRWDYLWQNSSIRDGMKYVVKVDVPDVTDMAARAALAQALGFRELFIGDMPYDSADEGQTVSISNLWTATRAFVFRRARTRDLAEPCLGRTMAWQQDGGVLAVEEYRSEDRRSDVYRVRQHVQEKKLLDIGYLLDGI